MESSNFDGCSCSNMENHNFVNCQKYTKIHNMIRWKSGKRVDPRLLGILESFEEIYTKRREFFKRIFDEDCEELFKKIDDALERKKKMRKPRSMQRSVSMRARGVDDQIDALRLERFKVKTPNVIEEGQYGTSQGDQTQTQSSSRLK